ncbi:CHC2 zinc finger domain-containing protein [Sphingomonas immobilis]|uniref:CHC2 zinc finger domain-containing protein n=1 Tax=Sphingomonas immobilis TaxID=3063997 RepID=A0ABT9A1W4_9SPHN|nr:CHC2 zinc finger domain-containing protein [Sphingomonas sp. CA1-15]MDO7843437.1 CHC2 zinc finger domain-containing protein [Sphingomonas sp. CA1-15]
MAGARRASGGGRRGGLDPAEFRRLVDDAKARHNLSDIAGRYTKLTNRGRAEKAGLCPFHDEKSPSFEVNDAKGTYYCHGCGTSGDAMSFLMRKAGLTFADAYRALAGDDFPVVSEEERARRKAEDAAMLAYRLEVAREVWAKSVPAAGTPAEVYARSRGITRPLPDTARFVMAPRWRNPETGEVGRDHPALACALLDADGAVVGVQCVFLAAGGRRKYERTYDDGTKAKAKLSFGVIVGSAFRASGTAFYGDAIDNDPAREIVVCEGPEDGLTLAQEMPTRSIWVACGTALMPRLVLPPAIRSIVLAGDNNSAGRTAVEEARSAFVEQGLAVSTMYPETGFKDWNDQLRGIRA